MLIALATVMFVGAMLVAPAPVQADHCAKEETKSCDKSESSDEKKDDEKKSCDKSESESSDEKKGCDKSGK
jgi:hypothetical protein